MGGRMNDKYIKPAAAAREKGVSRAAIYQALACEKINGEMVAGSKLVVRDAKFAEWTPKSH